MGHVDGAEQRLQGIRRVDLRGVELGGRGWEEARAAVAASMQALGAVVLVVQDALDPDLRRDLFGRAVPEFFALPLDAKRSLVSGPMPPSTGTSGRCPKRRRTRACAPGRPPTPAPSGTSATSSGRMEAILRSVSAFAANMLGLERKVGAMVLESLGVGQGSVASHLDSLNYSVRLSRYGVSEAGDGMLMKPHRDCTVLSVVVQHDVEGLEVQAQDGSWLAVAPIPDTVAVIAGELLAVVTNGRVPACLHRVSAPRGSERLSAQFVSKPKDGNTVRPLDELVDADHPPLYKPCDFDEYVRFRFAGDGQKLTDPLEAFCGVAWGP
ncbi:unnamed protein product [Urochloa decumbens]|uniref:Fe2OG dioxygenase domain-containing protein n=1 Tax=Urochloa decumbens TaxID=240449 RepID=A0ABC9BRA6_9POAL